MIYKRLLLLVVVSALSACSSLPGPFSSTQREESKTSDVLPNEVVGNDNVENTQTINKALPEQILAQSLISQSDLFQASRRTLSPNTKAKVVNVLNMFVRGELEQSEQSIAQILNNELNLTSGVYVLAGDISMANNKPNKAVLQYQQALKINEYNAKAANRLGMYMRTQGEFVESRALYTQAITAQPSMAQGYRNRAVLYDLYLNDKPNALEDYKRYSALLDYTLAAHHGDNSGDVNESVSQSKLTDNELKTLKTDIKLVKRWLIDVGRQVSAEKKAQAKTNNAVGG